jgi:hypothetical protein
VRSGTRLSSPKTPHVKGGRLREGVMPARTETKSFRGCTLFRHRIVAATLSGKAIRISDIRANTVSWPSLPAPCKHRSRACRRDGRKAESVKRHVMRRPCNRFVDLSARSHTRTNRHTRVRRIWWCSASVYSHTQTYTSTHTYIYRRTLDTKTQISNIQTNKF